MVQKKDIVTSVILTFLTCGIYGIIWFVNLTDDVNLLSEEKGESSGAMCFLLSILTCGIYFIYWSYRMGQKLKIASENYGLVIADNSVVYLVLCILKLDIVNYVLMQDNINRIVENARNS